MSTDNIDKSKRRFLTAATTVVGAVGAGAVAVPFVSSWLPSARAQAAGAPVEADISKLQPGGRLVIEWRGKPVWVVRRTEQNLKDLDQLVTHDSLKDPMSEVTEQQPTYAADKYRAQKSEYVVLVGICTHLGCSPTYLPLGAANKLGTDWHGGFFCPCHGSKFDLAGRVYNGVPAPTNLQVPPHKYLSESVIVIGVDEGVA
ncbi:Ubiquinol-cytochrome C reductase iron-sulfur subunit [hydrothermal vent metagenome]|uniref:Ubiquinol-cytochrome c reductase iron-sulfur subunit n=1 Tax=hydrothermal vent metagenome TaxID=652676 RepID=A0A3B1ACB9_9ZZZZ